MRDMENNIQEIEENNISDAEALFNMLGIDSIIRLSSELYLMGEFFDINSFENERQRTMEGLKRAMFKHGNTIGDVNSGDRILGYRGNYFRVIDSDGCILFDEYITITGEIWNTDKPEYVFALRDYKVANKFDSFFCSDTKMLDGLIYYDGKDTYTNCLELKDKYKYMENLKLERVVGSSYTLDVGNNVYSSYELSSINNVFGFNRVGDRT